MDVGCQHLDYSWAPAAECYECNNPACRALLPFAPNYPTGVCERCHRAIDDHRLFLAEHPVCP